MRRLKQEKKSNTKRFVLQQLMGDYSALEVASAYEAHSMQLIAYNFVSFFHRRRPKLLHGAKAALPQGRGGILTSVEP